MLRRRRIQIYALAFVPVLIGLLGIFLRWATEDAFIDFRVVQHLLAGHGPVFNLGERVEAYTNALWLALLAVVAAPLWPFLHERVPLPWIAVILGIVGSVAGVVLAQLGAFRLARARGRVGLALPAGMLAVVALPPAWSFITSGLETGLATCWLGLCFWACGRYPRAGRHWLPTVVGLGPLIRPDLGIYSAGFLLVLILLERRLRVLRIAGVLAAAAALPLAYQIFRMGYFAALVPNTAIAKEASSARWDQGLLYLADFARPYWLWVPLAIALGAVILDVRSILARRPRGRRRLLALTLVPIVCALLQATYVVRVGGDFMHGRMLLPAWFALMMPVAVIAGTRGRPKPRAPQLILAWGVVCAAVLRVPYIGGSNNGIGPHGIADERYYYSNRIGIWWPVSLHDYRSYGWPAEGEKLRVLATEKRELLPWRSEADGKKADRTYEMELAARVRSRLVVNRGHVGMLGYAAGLDVHVVDRLGLGDALAGRLALTSRGRPGHEKDMPDEWVVARFAAAAEPHTPFGKTKLEPKVRDARDALRCGELAELIEATEAPLTAARFAHNLTIARRLTALRIPRDPTAAKLSLCGATTTRADPVR